LEGAAEISVTFFRIGSLLNRVASISLIFDFFESERNFSDNSLSGAMRKLVRLMNDPHYVTELFNLLLIALAECMPWSPILKYTSSLKIKPNEKNI
jgi:hypothetical protein